MNRRVPPYILGVILLGAGLCSCQREAFRGWDWYGPGVTMRSEYWAPFWENGKVGFAEAKTGKVIVPIFDGYRSGRKDEVWILVRVGNKWGFIDADGSFVIPPRYDDARPFYQHLALVATRGKWECIDLWGRPVAEPLYFHPYDPFLEGLALTMQGGKWGFVDEQGEFVVRPRFDHAERFRDGLAEVKVGDLWGVIDRCGRFLIEPMFPQIERGLSPDDPWIVTTTGKKMGYVRHDGRMLVAPIFDGAQPFAGGVAWAWNDRGSCLVDLEGDVRPMYGATCRCGSLFQEGLSAFGCEPVWFVDTTGTPLPGMGLLDIEDATSFQEGLAAVRINGLWGFINTGGELVIKPQFKDFGRFNEGLAAVQEGLVVGYIDRTGRLAIVWSFDRQHGLAAMGWFREGLLEVPIAGKYGFIDQRGVVVIQPRFDAAGRFSQGRAGVRIGGKSGYIDRTGRLAIPAVYDSAGEFTSGRVAPVRQGWRHFWIDTSGTIVPRPAWCLRGQHWDSQGWAEGEPPRRRH